MTTDPGTVFVRTSLATVFGVLAIAAPFVVAITATWHGAPTSSLYAPTSLVGFGAAGAPGLIAIVGARGAKSRRSEGLAMMALVIGVVALVIGAAVTLWFAWNAP